MGKASSTRTWAGILKCAIRPAANSRTASTVSGSTPSFMITQAMSCSPYFSSGTPTTWTSWMSGWV